MCSFIREYRERAHLNGIKVLVPFLSAQKDWRATNPLPLPYILKVTQSKFSDSHFVRHS